MSPGSPYGAKVDSRGEVASTPAGPFLSDLSLLNLISIAGASLLFLPKINLIKFAGESAGLRIDDFLLVCIALALLILPGDMAREVRPVRKGVAIFIGFSLISNIANYLIYQRSSFFYTLRFAEYFVFFYIGYIFSKRHSLPVFVRVLLAVNGTVMVLQLFGLVGGFTSEGAVSNVSKRVVGLTGGPWEIGAMLNFGLAVIAFDRKMTPAKFSIYFAATLFLVLLTGARMPLVAHLALLLTFFLIRSRRKWLAVAKFAAASAFTLALLISVPNPVAERSENLFTTNNLHQFADLYELSEPSPKELQFAELPDDSSTDLSWLARAVKWTNALKLWVNSPSAWFIGVGPGYAGPALDGSWLRILVETGVFGLAAFIVLTRRIARYHAVTASVVVSLYINMIMIDLHLAYKAMSMVFLIAGSYARSNLAKSQIDVQQGK